MHTHSHSANAGPDEQPEVRRGRSTRWVFAFFVAMAAVLLALEHRIHLAGILPWLFLLACPLMHRLMHHHHGQHHGDRKDGDAG